MVGTCRKKGRKCNVGENDKREIVLKKKKKKTQDEMARQC
jgi:hypothetical protein